MEKFFLDNPWIIIVILLWTLPWKAAALWRAARRGHIGWFLTLIILNTLAILDILYIFVFSKWNNKKNEPIEKPQRSKYWEQYKQEDDLENENQLEKYQESDYQWEEEIQANQQDIPSVPKKRSTIV